MLSSFCKFRFAVEKSTQKVRCNSSRGRYSTAPLPTPNCVAGPDAAIKWESFANNCRVMSTRMTTQVVADCRLVTRSRRTAKDRRLFTAGRARRVVSDDMWEVNLEQASARSLGCDRADLLCSLTLIRSRTRQSAGVVRDRCLPMTRVMANAATWTTSLSRPDSSASRCP